MIKSANDYKGKFKEFLDSKIPTETDFDYWDYEGFDYKYLSDNLDDLAFSYIVFMDDKQNITNFAHYQKENGFDIFTLDDVDSKVIASNLEDLRNSFEHPLVHSLYSFYNDDKQDLPEIYHMNMKSKVIDENYVYMDELFCLNENDKDIIVDLADEKNFPSLIGEITYDVMPYSDYVYEEGRDDKIIPAITKDDSGHDHLAGFHYFGLRDGGNDKMVVAKNGDNIVGVIKYGKYGDGSYQPEHIGLCFIDVKKPYRGQGIATNLMKEFGKVVERENKEEGINLPIYLTDESEMGEKCHMRDTAVKEIKNVTCYYTDHKDYQYVVCLNGEELGRGDRLNKVLENTNSKKFDIEL